MFKYFTKSICDYTYFKIGFYKIVLKLNFIYLLNKELIQNYTIYSITADIGKLTVILN
jgi:hypothetical protein